MLQREPKLVLFDIQLSFWLEELKMDPRNTVVVNCKDTPSMFCVLVASAGIITKGTAADTSYS